MKKKSEPQPLTLDSLYTLFRRALFWAAVISLATLLGVLLFVTAAQRTADEAKKAAARAQAATDLVVEQRTEGRRIACEKDERFALAHNNLVNFFLNVPQDPTKPSDPELRKRFEDENIVPVPDCTPAGIAATYAGQAKK